MHSHWVSREHGKPYFAVQRVRTVRDEEMERKTEENHSTIVPGYAAREMVFDARRKRSRRFLSSRFIYVFPNFRNGALFILFANRKLCRVLCAIICAHS
jgi:hypothetical protein